ncbi:MAG: hypothetical protein GTN83_12940 [Acidobacteria bacterium]|nr:hypothetical protein [Acidobacteriota bacterium]
MQPLVDDALDEGRFRVQNLLPDCRVRRMPPSEIPVMDLDHALHNVNWPTDLASYR